MLTWVGGGERRELGERHERSAHVVAGVVVILNAVLAWLVSTLAVVQATRWSVLAVVVTLVFSLLVAAVTRAIASGPAHGLHGVAGRGLVAVAVGLIVGEFAALTLFSGTIDRHLERQAAANADSLPAVVQASTSLSQVRDARVALDKAVDNARIQRNEALVVARCEYHPSPACPQTRITGVPGAGPETRTANEVLADSQRELDIAVAARARQAPQLDAQISGDERAVAQARQTAIADADHGLGVRWVAMQDMTIARVGVLVLQLVTIAFFTLLSLLPLILRLWRGETTHDRHVNARAERERADLEAETAIAVKRAEVRAGAETLWAEQQLAQARLAVEAQTEIDRAQLRRRVTAELEGTAQVAEPVVAEDIYLPIAAEAEAASLAATPLPEPEVKAVVNETENLPASVESRDIRATPAIPTIPNVTKAAARWIRPLVPGFVARAIDTSTHPLRSARQVIEEFEEITFTLKRTRKLTVDTQESAGLASSRRSAAMSPDDVFGDVGGQHRPARPMPSHGVSTQFGNDVSLPSSRRENLRELTERDGPIEMRAADGLPQLPSAE